MYSAIRRQYSRKREEWHSRRLEFFLDVMRPRAGTSVLDLGGSDGEFMHRMRKHVDVEVTVADISETALEHARERGFSTVTLREGEPLPFRDGEFDIVFCNSVIEHATVPKKDCAERTFTNEEWVALSIGHQQEFARELRRIARNYFVQTPHVAFPLESHTWLPFVGWLSHDATVRLVRITDRVWAKHCGYVDWHLLGERVMKYLFPEAHLHVERVLGLPKSLIAYFAGQSC